MRGRPLIEREISPRFEVIEWNGDKGKVADLGRIAFPPRSATQKVFYGKKVSFVFRGMAYRDPYTGSELRKGHVIALPVEVLNDVNIIKAREGLTWISDDFSTVTFEMIFYYEREYRGQNIRGKIKYYKSVPIASVINKPAGKVLSRLFDIPEEKIEFSDGRCDLKEERDGYIIKRCELHIRDGKYILKEEQEEDLAYAPLDVLLQKLDSLSVKLYGYFTTDSETMQERRSFLHPCLDDYFTIKPSVSAYSFKMNSRTLSELLNSGKLEIKKIIMRKVHTIEEGQRYWEYTNWSGQMSFDDFLEELREYDILKFKEEIDKKTKRIEEINNFKHYYANLSKEHIIQKFHELWKVTHKGLVEDIDKRAWVKVLEEKVGADISYTEWSYDISIIIPEKQLEIKGYYSESDDEYACNKGGDYTREKTEITEKELRKQEAERKEEIEKLNKEIEELKERIEEYKKKNPRELYNNIVQFFSRLNNECGNDGNGEDIFKERKEE